MPRYLKISSNENFLFLILRLENITRPYLYTHQKIMSNLNIHYSEYFLNISLKFLNIFMEFTVFNSIFNFK